MDKKIEKLVNDFVIYLQKTDECTKTGNRKKGDKYTRIYIKCWEDIKKIGDEARQEMLKLLQHEDDSVKSAAAACLLRYNTEESMKVLKKIAARKGMNALGAQATLQNWENGTWDLDP